MDDSIENFMSQSIHTIASDRSLAEAHEMMRKYKIRHLPVLEHGELVGLVSERDLTLVESFKVVNSGQVRVSDAMSEDVFSVDAETPIAQVAQRMAHDRLGSAVVTRNGKVTGIFTGIDALRALDFLLTSPPVKHALREAMIPRPQSSVS